MGGNNIYPTQQNFKIATDICYQASTREIINQTEYFLKNGIHVMIVAKDTNHQHEIKNMIIDQLKISSNDIFVLEKNESIYLTDEAVKDGKIHDYKVVIVPLRKSEGYTLTRLGAMIKVYIQVITASKYN